MNKPLLITLGSRVAAICLVLGLARPPACVADDPNEEAIRPRPGAGLAGADQGRGDAAPPLGAPGTTGFVRGSRVIPGADPDRRDSPRTANLFPTGSARNEAVPVSLFSSGETARDNIQIRDLGGGRYEMVGPRSSFNTEAFSGQIVEHVRQQGIAFRRDGGVPAYQALRGAERVRDADGDQQVRVVVQLGTSHHGVTDRNTGASEFTGLSIVSASVLPTQPATQTTETRQTTQTTRTHPDPEQTNTRRTDQPPPPSNQPGPDQPPPSNVPPPSNQPGPAQPRLPEGLANPVVASPPGGVPQLLEGIVSPPAAGAGAGQGGARVEVGPAQGSEQGGSFQTGIAPAPVQPPPASLSRGLMASEAGAFHIQSVAPGQNPILSVRVGDIQAGQPVTIRGVTSTGETAKVSAMPQITQGPAGSVIRVQVPSTMRVQSIEVPRGVTVPHQVIGLLPQNQLNDDLLRRH